MLAKLPTQNATAKYSSPLLVLCCSVAGNALPFGKMSKKIDIHETPVSGNPGNFLGVVRLLAVHDNVLRCHLEAPALRCATYLSPPAQNELIEVTGKYTIVQGILDDLNAAPYYTILAAEVTSQNEEHFALCARFVDTEDARKFFCPF